MVYVLVGRLFLFKSDSQNVVTIYLLFWYLGFQNLAFWLLGCNFAYFQVFFAVDARIVFCIFSAINTLFNFVPETAFRTLTQYLPLKHSMLNISRFFLSLKVCILCVQLFRLIELIKKLFFILLKHILRRLLFNLHGLLGISHSFLSYGKHLSRKSWLLGRRLLLLPLESKFTLLLHMLLRLVQNQRLWLNYYVERVIFGRFNGYQLFGIQDVFGDLSWTADAYV